MKSTSKALATPVARFLALLLLIGGIVGIVVSAGYELSALMASGVTPTLGVVGAFVVIFGWCTWTGMELWRKKIRAVRWAQILFALQIPTIAVPGFSYEIHTGLTMRFLFSGARINFDFNLGSSFSSIFRPRSMSLWWASI